MDANERLVLNTYWRITKILEDIASEKPEATVSWIAEHLRESLQEPLLRGGMIRRVLEVNYVEEDHDHATR